MLDCKSMQVKTWFAREKRSTEAFTRARASSERAIWARTGLRVDPATRCTAQALIEMTEADGALRTKLSRETQSFLRAH